MTLRPSIFEAFWDSASGCIGLRRSTDAGATWASSSVTRALGYGIALLEMQFVDRHDGWILATGFPGASQAPRTLFRTVDGGALWSAVAAKQPFPESDTNVVWGFTSPSAGWMVTVNPFYGPPARVFVYHSTDGGQTWSQSSFAVPEADSFAQFSPELPVLTADGRGTLKIDASQSATSTTLVYTTANGGRTWTLEPPSGGN